MSARLRTRSRVLDLVHPGVVPPNQLRLGPRLRRPFSWLCSVVERENPATACRRWGQRRGDRDGWVSVGFTAFAPLRAYAKRGELRGPKYSRQTEVEVCMKEENIQAMVLPTMGSVIPVGFSALEYLKGQ
jgi:hypothetical protein